MTNTTHWKLPRCPKAAASYLHQRRLGNWLYDVYEEYSRIQEELDGRISKAAEELGINPDAMSDQELWQLCQKIFDNAGEFPKKNESMIS